MALPIETGLAGRYATALFELAVEQKAIDTVKADLDGGQESEIVEVGWADFLQVWLDLFDWSG